MRILLSAFMCEPGKGSEPGIGWNSAIHLARQGDNELWVLTKLEFKAKIEEKLNMLQLTNLHFIYIQDSQRIRHISFVGYFLNYYYWQWKAYKVATVWDKEINFDVVHHVTLGSLQGGSWMWKLRKPFVFGPVGGGQFAPSAFKKYFEQEWFTESLRTLFRCKLSALNPLIRWTIHHSNLILATNTDTFDMINKLGGSNKVMLCLDSSLPEEFYPDTLPQRVSHPSCLHLLWVGRIMPRKALNLALEAISKVASTITVKLTIIGGGQYASKIQSWIQKYNVKDRIEYKGELPWEELRGYYLSSDAFLFTSLRDSFGSQVLEAMAFGLPIIGLDHQGIRDFVPQQVGMKIKVHSPDQVTHDLSQAIEYLANHPDKRLAMGRIGWEFARTCSWDQFSKKMTGYYNNLIT
ncbi:hypothetical protein Back11_31940 [Paenibacillus baekrokdamisoli]|uniref:Uncharacterized protein n=1 Tax=Paenibacillus baekrokdamisoli TaxID=1712516 RepID=A0A3G9JFU4_9BACL|nr:glycosyltransferase [Paenibacillus baekrokdamisoli]MBB3071641.1 glycosyltransferase involved in cell wall biosynthesis [Paenibacillus baekrokdamisoli]BBH21849.1 hypothetical protein Back11_31940 [Paenibacillus baekrokdamisoli]